MTDLPAVGTFLMPIQNYRTNYALQVLEVIDCADSHAPGIKQVQYRRWGLDAHRRPYDDGHHNKGSETGCFRPVGNRAWRIHNEGRCWDLGPIYFKQIPAPTVAGQLSLFL